MSENIITIAELEAITTAPGSSFIAVDNGTTTNKITVDNFVSSSNQTAQTYATAAESYAKGGTSSRTGEDTDNAMYYKEQAASIARTISDNIDIAEEQVTSAIDAKNLAQSASRAAESNANRAQSSQLYAAASASSASTSANAASQQATLASNAKTAAESAATDALGYKDTAVDAASDAQGYATDAERYASAASASADAAAAVAVRTPYVGENGNWYVWDAEENDFVDSGEKAKGDKGDTGNTGATPTISMTATTDAIASPNPSVTVTKSGTDAAPSFAMAFTGLKGPKGDTGSTGPDGVSPAVTISNITGGHTVTITDKDHPSGQSFDVMDGTGAGDMLSSTYDSTSSVANAGGIPDYVDTAVSAYVENTLAKLDIIEDFSAYPNAVNVRNYGAVGDGTTNDYSAFSDAITYAVQNDLDIIVLPEGSYNLNPDDTANVSLILGKALTFVGESSNTTEIINSCIVAPYGITCKNITFNGGTERTVSQGGYPSFINNKEISIFATPEYADASVIYDKCVFKNTGLASVAFLSTGYTTPLVESNVTDCVFEDITFCGIFHSLNIESARVEGNVFKNIGNTLIPETSTPQLSNKILALCLGDISNTSNNECTSAIIRNNVFDTLITATDTANHSHYVNANFIGVVCEQATIKGNVVNNLTGYGDDRESIYTKGNNVEICDNLVVNGGSGEGYICAKYKLNTTSDARVINIHHNILIGEYDGGIQCYGNCYIHDNSISIKRAWRAIRGNAITGHLYGCFRVENNNIYCGAGAALIDGTQTARYTPANLISCGGEYLKGIYINGNSISTEQTDTTYSTRFGYLIYVERVASDVEVKGNFSSGDWVQSAVGLVDNNDSSAVSSDKNITLCIEDNNFDTVEKRGLYCGIVNNSHLKKKYLVRNNIIKGTIKHWDISYALTINSSSASSNDDVLYYESEQPLTAFWYKPSGESEIYSHVNTAVNEIYTSLPTTYFTLQTGAVSTFIDTDFADYALASSVPTALSSLSDDSTHRLVTDTEKSTWSGKSTVTTDHYGTASSTGVRKQRISIDGTYYDIDGSVYMEQTITLSTSASVTATFTNAAILSTSVIEVFAGRSGGDVSGSKNAFPFESIYTTAGSCAVTFPKEDSAISLKVRIYIR